ncbi:hypothetical protein KRR26_04435 [Corallococcus sp. M34]|uniref:hypothetical protein n=1 Tax=Citreicoccus inhibens TaxID=2849499 RepID=UPI001C232A67|nr:hypothetical protein [Citreicoccus inhibens]MBU8894835.1 hypothetical protein [Citreicoccus inhibens]
MRRNGMKAAVLWMLPVGWLSACGGAPEAEAPDAVAVSHQALLSPPATPVSGNIGDSFPYTSALTVGGAKQAQCDSVPGYAGYTLQAQAGSQLKLEITHLGSSMGLDTGLYVYGPKNASGSYGSVVQYQDDDSGYGELSKIGFATFTQGGEYLVAVGWGNAAGKQYRLQVDCVGGSCLSAPPDAPSGYTLTLAEQPITAALQALLAAENTVREDQFSYLRRIDFLWPYAGEAALDRAAESVLAQSLYTGYRNYQATVPPVVITYPDLLSTMYNAYQPLHAAILAAYGNGTESVQVKSYFRAFSTGPNGDAWGRLNFILFPQSKKIIVFEQTGHEI